MAIGGLTLMRPGAPCCRHDPEQAAASQRISCSLNEAHWLEMRPARLLRRGYSLLHKRGNQQQAGPEQRTNLQKYDGEEPGGPGWAAGPVGVPLRAAENNAAAATLSRLTFRRNTPAAATCNTPADPAEEKYGGWKSAEMLFGDEVPRKSLIGRCAGGDRSCVLQRICAPTCPAC